MKSLLLTFFTFLMITMTVSAQVSITTDSTAPDGSAMLDIKSTVKGILIPRMTTAQRTIISNPATGLLVFDTDSGSFWFYNGTAWEDLSKQEVPDKIADADTNTLIQVEKYPNEDQIRFDVNGTEVARMDGHTFHFQSPGKSLFIGKDAGSADDGTDNGNTMIGFESGMASTGYRNTYLGYRSGKNSISANNTFIGTEAGKATLDGSNTFIGNSAGINNTHGEGGVFIGSNAGEGNTTGDNNIYIGAAPASMNQTGSRNIAIGRWSGTNALGSGNVFIGDQAGYNETGSNTLYIDNSNTSTPLIYGDFANDMLRINGSLNLNNSYTFPDSAGTNGQMMMIDGSGNTNWVDAPADNLGNHIATQSLDMAGHSVDNASTINAGFLGLGTAASGFRMDAMDSTRLLSGNKDIVFTWGHYGPSNNQATEMYFDRNNIGFNQSEFVLYNSNDNVVSNRFFQLQYTADTSGLSIRKGGKIGIGTTAPAEKLEVNGNVMANSFIGDGSALTNVPGDDLGNHMATDTLRLNNNWITNGNGSSFGIALDSNGTLLSTVYDTFDWQNYFPRPNLFLNSPIGQTSIRFNETDLNADPPVNVWDVGTFSGYFLVHDRTNETIPFQIEDGASTNLLVLTGGGVGIGTTGPTEKLDVNGKIRMRTGAHNGYIPVGSSNGTMTWTDPASISTMGDNLGNHTATQNINLGSHWLTNGTGNIGLSISAAGTGNWKTNSSSSIGRQMESGDTPALRFLQNTSQGWPTHTWDIGGNESSLFIRDVSNSSMVPFKVEAGSSMNRIVVQGQNVGIGNDEPEKTLDVGGDIQLTQDDPEIMFKDTTGSNGIRISAIQTTLVSQLGNDYAENQKMSFHVSNGGNGMAQVMTLQGNGAVGINTSSPTSDLDVNGSVRIRGGSPQSGDILSATDSNGNAAWVDPKTKVVQADTTLIVHNNDDTYWDVVTTPALNVETGDLIVIYCTAQGQMTGGSGEDLFHARIRVHECGSDIDLTSHTFAPPQDAGSHNGSIALPVLATYSATCSGTITFSYRLNNSGDDSYAITTPVLVAIKQ